MAKLDEERAYVKAVQLVPLTEEELKTLKSLTAIDLLDMGTLSNAVTVKRWCKSEGLRHLATKMIQAKKIED